MCIYAYSDVYSHSNGYMNVGVVMCIVYCPVCGYVYYVQGEACPACGYTESDVNEEVII